MIRLHSKCELRCGISADQVEINGLNVKLCCDLFWEMACEKIGTI